VSDGRVDDHVRVNRDYWDGRAHEWAEGGAARWSGEPCWGIWGVPEADLGLLPDDMRGLDAIELGCGTAYVCGWMARRGARTVVGVDASAAQLATARRLAARHGVAVGLVHANAETLPLRDESFDFAVSEYGAAIWCDPHVWVPEAARVLRPGGRLVFLGNTPLATVCSPASGEPCTRRLERDYFGLHRTDWRQVEHDPGGVDFNLPISEWIRLFHATGLTIVDYAEVRAPADADDDDRSFVSAEWARRWPAEQVWKLVKR